MKIAFLYGGQGAQQMGMGADLYETNSEFKKAFDNFEESEKLKKLCFETENDVLSQTQNTQPAMVAFSIAVTKALKASAVVPEMVAGLSLGEYSALYTAGVFTENQAISLVSYRGAQMAKAGEGIESAMVAVLGLDAETLQSVCDECSNLGVVSIANFNCPGQLILSGEKIAVETAGQKALEKGAKRALPINVSGPFHTSLMSPAGDALKTRFSSECFGKMQIPVVFNATAGELKSEESVEQLLERQVQESVYFENSVRYMLEQGVDTFIEISPNKVLANFVRKISKDARVLCVQNAKTLEETIEKLKEL